MIINRDGMFTFFGSKSLPFIEQVLVLCPSTIPVLNWIPLTRRHEVTCRSVRLPSTLVPTLY